jgi:hypothetical protein
LTDEQSESVGSSSNISQELGGIQPKTIRRSWNWQNISVEAPSRGNGMSLPGGIQRQREEQQETLEIQAQLAANSAQKSALESSNLTISTSEPAQKPLIARTPFNGRNIPVEAPQSSAASSTYFGGIQRLETSGVKEQEKSLESLQMQSEEETQAKSSESEKPEKEEINNSSIQTKLTVGAPGDKYEQEADSMAAKVLTMPDSAIQQPIQRQTVEDTEAVQMQPLVNSISPLVQRKSGTEEEVQMKSEVHQASDGSSVASSSIENRLASSKGGGNALPDNVRRFMEPRFGADFRNIKVHTDSNAVQMNKEVGAQAFAHGSDIYYGAGKSPGNNELTAHELTHTIQQGAAGRINKEVFQKPQQEKPIQAKQFTNSHSFSNRDTIQRQSLAVTSVSPRIQGEFIGIGNAMDKIKKAIVKFGKQQQRKKGTKDNSSNPLSPENTQFIQDAKTHLNQSKSKLSNKSQVAEVESLLKFFTNHKFSDKSLLLANVVVNEAGIASFDSKKAVAYAYLNRTGNSFRAPKGAEISNYIILLKDRFNKFKDYEKTSFLRQFKESVEAAEVRINDQQPNKNDPTQGSTHWISPDASIFNKKIGTNTHMRIINGKSKFVPEWARSNNDPDLDKLKTGKNAILNSNFKEIEGIPGFLFYRGVK